MPNWAENPPYHNYFVDGKMVSFMFKSVTTGEYTIMWYGPKDWFMVWSGMTDLGEAMRLVEANY